MKKIFFFLLFWGIVLNSICENSFAQGNVKAAWGTANPFKTDVLVENKGQFDSWAKTPAPIKYAVNNSDKIFFTQQGLTFLLTKVEKRSEEEREELERNGSNEVAHPYFINMQWEGCNENPVLEVSEESEGYYTFGEKGFENVMAKGYRKLTYKELYPGIDAEYIVPDKGGIKYSLIIHPGADASKVKMKYSGDVDKIEISAEGNILIKTPAGEITDHAPLSFYKKTSEKINSAFEFKGNLVSFKLQIPNPQPQTIILDPWTTTPSSLTTNNAAYDIDYDIFGNVYVSGGTLPFKLVKYSAAGAIIWTFTTPANWGSWMWPTYTRFCLIPGSGSSFIGEAQLGAANPRIMKIRPNGTLQTTTPVLLGTAEIWYMFYNSCNGKLIGFGGGTKNANNMQMVADTNLSSSTPRNFNGSAGALNDIAIAKMDDNGDFYALMSSTGNPNMNHIQKSLTSTNYNPPCAWDVNSGYTYNEAGNTGIPGFNPSGAFATVRANALALNSNYLYSYDGKTLKAWNKTTGAMLGSVVVNVAYLAGKDRNHEGIAVDDCDNIYVGGKNIVYGFSFSGTAFTPLAPIVTNIPNEVFDVQINRSTNMLFVCGQSFVSVIQLTTAPCSVSTMTVTSTTGSCASPATATANVTGGNAPYTYTWSNGQTTQTISGLASGTYSVLVTDNSCVKKIFTGTVVVTSTGGVAVTCTQTNASCSGSDGTATATPAGGTLPFTYSWSPVVGAGATVTGLSAGTYTVIVTDATGCSGTSTVTVNSSGTFTLNASSSPTGCAVSNGTATVNTTGGTSPFAYSWNNGQTAQTATGLAAGTYTATVTDAGGCTQTQTVAVTQPSSIAATSTSTPTPCGTNNGTATAVGIGGASPYIYSWSPGGQTNSTATGLGAGVYAATVTDASGCSSITTVTVTSIGGPTASVSADVTIVSGSPTTLTASGGATYTWSNGESVSEITVAPSIMTIYCVTVSDTANCSDTACVTVFIEETDCSLSVNAVLYIPNSFSPNGDGENDFFSIYYGAMHCISAFDLYIYNRWGEIVYRSTDPLEQWDGAWKGKFQNVAVFVYYMKATLITGEEIIKKGNVSLVK